MPLASNNNSVGGSGGGSSGMKSVSPSQIAAMNGNGQQQYTEYTTTNIPAFLSKLWPLVEDPKYDQLIAWDASGFSFHVYDQTRFSKEILPRFFKHNNMASFIRQLNMYGFRKVNSIDHGSLKNEKEDLEFHHPYFIRGKEQFLEFIKRKVPDIKPNSSVSSAPNSSQAQPSALVSPTNQPVVQYPSIKTDDLNKVLDDVNSIKSKQKFVDDSLMDVKKENEVLWKEIASLRQKHHHQQQIVNKLIHFLVHLVNPSSLGIKRARPLMIDSHSANSLANVGVLNGELSDSEDACGGEINEIDDEDEEEFLSNNHITLDQPPNKKTKLNHSVYMMPSSRQQIGTTDLKNIQSGGVDANKTNKFGQNQNFSPNGNVGVNSTMNYSTANQGVVINEIIDSPTSLMGFEPSNAKDIKSVNTHNGDFIDTNLFLNANPSSNQTNHQHQHQLDSNGPIITTPASPLDDVHKSGGGIRPNGMISATTATTTAPSMVQSTPTLQLNDASSLTLNSIDPSDLSSHEMKRHLSLINSSSNQQMNDHVEALQLDLASIKEFLSSNSFNQIDPFTISNLFSPLDLDLANDNDSFYLEPPPLPLSSSLGSSEKLKQIGPAALDSIIPSVLDTLPTQTDGRINGNELVDYNDPSTASSVKSVVEEQTSTASNSIDFNAFVKPEVKWTLGADDQPQTNRSTADTSLLLDDDTILSTPLISTDSDAATNLAK